MRSVNLRGSWLNRDSGYHGVVIKRTCMMRCLRMSGGNRKMVTKQAQASRVTVKGMVCCLVSWVRDLNWLIGVVGTGSAVELNRGNSRS